MGGIVQWEGLGREGGRAKWRVRGEGGLSRSHGCEGKWEVSFFAAQEPKAWVRGLPGRCTRCRGRGITWREGGLRGMGGGEGALKVVRGGALT